MAGNKLSVKQHKGERGFGRLKSTLVRMPKQAALATAFGAYDGMQPMMEEAKDRAPKDTEAMARSGYVAKPAMYGSGRVRVESGFGGDSEQYVVRQHEDYSLNHPNGGEAGFFSKALMSHERRIVAAIQKWVSVFLRTGKLLAFPAKRVPESPWEDRVAGG